MYISSRGDRYGANSIPYISALFLSNCKNTPLYHNCDHNCHKYKNTIIHQYLEKKTNPTTDQTIINNNLHKDGSIWNYYITNQIHGHLNKTFPDVFHDSPIFHELRSMYFDKYGNDSITSNATVIHVRLDDLFSHGTKNQEFIGTDNLIKLINRAQEMFNTEIFLITSPNQRDKDLCQGAIEKSNYTPESIKQHVLGSNDIDYDIFLMLTSKHLITSRSTFSFIPALLSNSNKYTYCEWSHYFHLLGTYDLKCSVFPVVDFLQDAA